MSVFPPGSRPTARTSGMVLRAAVNLPKPQAEKLKAVSGYLFSHTCACMCA